MNNSSFDQWNLIFKTYTSKSKVACKFGFVPNCDVEDIFYNDFLSWERNDVTLEQFYFHEYGHIIHNRFAHMQYGGWSIAEDRHGRKVVNKQFYRWFIKQNFHKHEHRIKIPSLYHHYLNDYREWWAETFSIWVHKVMGWPLRESQETFYTLCVERHLATCPIWKVLWDIVKLTVLQLRS